VSQIAALEKQEKRMSLPVTKPDNPFRTFWDLGYTRLVPVIPPDAPISDKSKLAVRIANGDDARGKAPGVMGDDGRWRGVDFVKIEATEYVLDVWNDMGASVGIKTGHGLIAVDIDTTHGPTAKLVYEEAMRTLGPALMRQGRKPKSLLLYEGPEDAAYQCVQFQTETEAKARIELLTERRQFVAHGTHPATGKPYAWPRGIPPRNGITKVSAQQIAAFFGNLQAALPQAKGTVEGTASEAPEQETLRAPDWETFRRTVETLPNTTDLFPTRNDYLTVACAIKAAAPKGHEEDAKALFLEWCDRWTDSPEGESNDPEIAEADYARCKPPFRVGFQFLAEHSPGLWFNVTDPDTIGLPAEDDMFAANAAAEKRKDTGYQLMSLTDVFAMLPPRFLLGRHLPEQGMGLLYGDPGTGKSFLALSIALSVAYGLPDWFGDEITVPDDAGVLYIAGEGASGFRSRVKAWQKKHPEHLLSKAGAEKFRFLFQPVNFLRHEDIARLIETVKRANLGRLSLIVVDTVSRSIPGADENLQKDMTLFVAAVEALRAATGAFVLGVHHAGKAGQMRGSSVFSGQADVVLRLERKKAGLGQSMIGKLICEKQKDAPDGWQDSYRLDAVDTGEDGSQSLVPVRLDAVEAEAQESLCGVEMQDEILAAMKEAWEAGDPWGVSHQAKDRYAPRLISTRWGVEQDAALQWLDIWERDGLCARSVYSPKQKKRGWKVLDELSENRPPGGDIFT
jgi:hypothetical protein